MKSFYLITASRLAVLGQSHLLFKPSPRRIRSSVRPFRR
ncbi:hypothetical protein J3R75_002776 [Oligosphaera ethanolica]|uniref:Uncharacterized protein n=1 Tax=Oligosphaera ethanolica TaxID=760260 RepID=A0AAE3VHQ4_9BACT|nr:hypothetical protein [Oligosphaera ethanolica]